MYPPTDMVGGSRARPRPLDREFLGQIACTDPRLARALLGPTIRPDLLGLGVPECGSWGWQIINLVARFEAGAADQFLTARQNGIIETDLWIRQVTYTVRRPNAFAGSIFKGQSDWFNRQNPNIDFRLIVKSFCRYTIAVDPTPLENIETVFECTCPVGMVLGCSAQLEATFQNLRALAADEVPTEAIISLHGVRLPTSYTACSVEVAVKALIDAGILAGLPEPQQLQP